ncbi:unnamed protein product, partial [Prunus brigantina]
VQALPVSYLPFFHGQSESVEHTSFLRPWAARVWLSLVLLIDLCLKLSLRWIVIWKTRCNLVYDKSNFCPPSPELTASLADRSVVEFLSHMRLKDDRNHFNSPPLDSHLWVNPLVGTVKINCVDAWDKVTNAGSALQGYLQRDHTGSLLDGSAHCFQSSPVVQAQCHAIRSGLELVHVRGFINVIVETDFKLQSPLSGGQGLLKMRTMQLTGWLRKQEGGCALRLGSFDLQSPWSSYVYLAHRT